MSRGVYRQRETHTALSSLSREIETETERVRGRGERGRLAWLGSKRMPERWGNAHIRVFGLFGWFVVLLARSSVFFVNAL